MDNYSKQLLKRLSQDEQEMSDALTDVADSLTGRRGFHDRKTSDEAVRREIETVCRYFGAPFPEELPETDDINDLIDIILRPSGIMRRRVLLTGRWWEDAEGPLLAAIRDSGGQVKALLPQKVRGFYYRDPVTEEKIRLKREQRNLFEEEALCFYRPLPAEPVSDRDFLRFLFRSVSPADLALVILASFLATGLGLLTPLITRLVFSQLIPTGKINLIYSLLILLCSTAVAIYLITAVKTRLTDRIRIRMDVALQNAVAGRLIRLPAGFFQGKSAGGTAQQAFSLNLLPDILSTALLGSAVSAIFAFLYVVQTAVFTPVLCIPMLVTLLAQLLVILWCTWQKSGKARAELQADLETQGFVFALIAGIQRIRLSGSEKRSFARWALRYRKKANAKFRMPFPAVAQNELITAITLIGTWWVYARGLTGGISVPQFASFLSSFGLATASFLSLSQSSQSLAYLKPILETARPILEAVPESGTDRHSVGALNGNIELNHVSFRYTDDGPLILNDISLKICAGDYVAIVGRTGCGKSTLLRLLLGFESPETGSIFYDGIDLQGIDPASLRRCIGTVLQDGRLFAGDIYSNITVSAPWLSEEDAWKAAEMAGAGETIRNLPMGMHTLISEGSGGISGGQKQRLMIARAIAPKPAILIFDEATSALDNISQKAVADSLNELSCTRIVVAHRLSTIRHCDRIIAIDGGKIIEDGTYEELIAADGFFADLVKRQQQ